MPHPSQSNRALFIRIIFFGCILFIFTSLSGRVNAASFIVDITTDENDSSCVVGDCSLREAIIAANGNGSTYSTVTIPPGIYTLSIAGTNENAGATGDLDINTNMSIQGSDPSTTIIDANEIDRVFHVKENISLAIQNISVRDGKSLGSGFPTYEGMGGGIFVQGGVLNLFNSVILSNSAISGGGISSLSGSAVSIINSTLSNNLNILDGGGEGGGAIFAGGGTLRIWDSSITTNTGTTGGVYSYATSLIVTRTTFSNNVGGGLYAGGNITVTDSTFSNNSSTITAAGILNFGDLIVTGSTFVGNSTTESGGAIHAWRGTTQITNSTFSGNSAEKGGAVTNADVTDALATSSTTITNSTFFGNSATSGIGSGVYSDDDGTLTLKGNILANGSGSNCAVNTGGTLTSTGYNISDNGTCNPYFTEPTDQNSVNPLLVPLQNNGGNTFTHALQTGSPAINAIPAANCSLSTDQRRIGRPQGNTCDIGAYEAELGSIQTGSIFTVNVTTDNNESCTTVDCSLREAIKAANELPDANTITFDISSGGLQTIQLAFGLPAITSPVIIDGTTQPGYVGTPLIELDGSMAEIDANGLVLAGGNSTVRGLVINRFKTNGIVIKTNGGNTIIGNFIGTDATGTLPRPNGQYVSVPNPMVSNGIYVDATAPNNIIGGTDVSERNVISGNNFGVGIMLMSSGNIVRGNFIGTNAAGTSALGNGFGVGILRANSNTVGGTSAGAGNIISGNEMAAMEIAGSSNIIQGNYIGTDVTGILPIGNAWVGISIAGGELNPASNNLIGGTVPGAGNIIAFNATIGPGIGINDRATTIGNAVLGNSIFANGSLGIDIGPEGLTVNDVGDGDVGGNNLQNFPLLDSAGVFDAGTIINGTLNSQPATTYRLEFFANAACDPTGYGEGQTYLGFANVTTNGTGNAVFSANLSAVTSIGQLISATATDPNNNTSEFSACVPVIVIPPPSAPTAAPSQNYFTTSSVPLSWKGVSWAVGYEIEVDTDDDFADPFVYSNRSLAASAQSDIATSLPDGTYYWRVGAKKPDGSIVWSAVQSFTVDVP
jgi:CSLREA domain-containing protein